MAISNFSFESLPITWEWETLEVPAPRLPNPETLETGQEPPLKRARLDAAAPAEPLPSPIELGLLPKPPILRSLEDLYNAEVLGAGSFGKVFKVVDAASGAPCAIKVNHSRRKTAWAVHEAQVLQLLSDMGTAHRLQLRETCSLTSTKFAIVTDFIPAKNIHEAFLSSRSTSLLTFSDITTIARQSLEFLSSLRSKRLVHGDLKVDNLIFEKGSRYLTVLDCGKCTADRTFPVGGSLQVLYQRPPEELLKEALNSDYDLWTLACILYQIFTKTLLFPLPHVNEEKENYRRLMGMMIEQIGMPPRNFLLRGALHRDYFIVFENVEFIEGHSHVTESWKHSIRLKGIEQEEPPEKIEQFIDLLSQMLRWEKRTPPAKLLRSPLFDDDIKLHLSTDASFKGMIYFYRHTDVIRLADQASPSLTIAFSDHVTRTCFHIERDPEDLYDIVVRHNGRQGLYQQITLHEGTTLNLR